MKKLLCTLCLSVLSIGVSPSAFAEANVVILMGAPGSGKSTQAEKLSHALNVPAFTIAELYTNELKKQSDLGIQLKKEAFEGLVVTDKELVQLVVERSKNPDCQNGFILNGFPKTLEQAAALRDQIDTQAHVTVFHLDLNDQEAITRLADKPNSDDEVINERLKAYHDKTEPLLFFYKKSCQLTSLDAKLNVDQMTSQMVQILKKHQEGHATAACPTTPTEIPH
ncbi:MAG: nucleoside monophosphate kinase [Parachlamydiales bacterium]|nr:nucleoside monophosphate kinase [Parachlamydiales bacterium]